MTWDVFLRRLAAGERLTVLTAEAGVDGIELVNALDRREWVELLDAYDVGHRARMAGQVPA